MDSVGQSLCVYYCISNDEQIMFRFEVTTDNDIIFNWCSKMLCPKRSNDNISYLEPRSLKTFYDDLSRLCSLHIYVALC